jgi:hypothetical protein
MSCTAGVVASGLGSILAAESKQVKPSIVAPEGLHEFALEDVKVIVVGEVQIVETGVGLNTSSARGRADAEGGVGEGREWRWGWGLEAE